MKIVQFTAFGEPSQVAACVEVADVGAPAADEIVVAVEAFPINPVDLLTVQGRYAARPALPARLGSEGVGRVTAVGAGVADLRPGDRVINLGRDNWAEKLKIKADQAIKVPNDGDVLQQAMLKINPATALCMLRDFVTLAAGEWVIQDAANSGVGRNLIRLAKGRGLRSVNVVRREALVAPLRALGADVVLVDGADLAQRVAAATDGARIRLAIDAVAGETCRHLAQSLADGGTVVNYGLLSGQPCMIDPFDVVFRSIDLTGFWLGQHLRVAPPAEVQAIYQELGPLVANGTLATPIEATYPLAQIQAALEHAARPGRDGKILITPVHPAPGEP